jgi:transcriptional regulator with XRE-family HTH domain
MIFRHLSETSAAISLDAALEDLGGVQAPPRRVSRQDLADPGRYALIAWGVAERLRVERERANLRIAQLAHACEIDPSHLSRIENADTNVSLDTLVRLARFLRISLSEMLSPPARCRDVGALPGLRRRARASGRQPVLSRELSPHLLHPVAWDAPAGFHGNLADATPPGARSSWIVLDGRVIFEIPGLGPETTPELLEAGSVIHFRRGAPASVNAMQDSRMLQVVCSVQCLCNAVASP